MAGMDRTTGRSLEGWPHVVQSVGVILSTRIGSRLMRRAFGSAVPGLLGRNFVPQTVLKFFTVIAIAIDLWEPRFKVRRFSLPNTTASGMQQGILSVRIEGDYRPRALQGDMTVERSGTLVLGQDGLVRAA